MRKFPEAPDRKVKLRMPETDLKAWERNSFFFSSDRWIGKSYFSPAVGLKTVYPLIGTLVYSSTSGSRFAKISLY